MSAVAPGIPNVPGVYLLTHRKTGDTYVGKALYLEERISQHIYCLRGGYHESSILSALCAAHGVDFEIKVLELTTRETRRAAELRWIEKMRPTLNSHDCKFRIRERPPKIPKVRTPPIPRRNISIRIEVEIANAIQLLAREDDRTMSYVIEKLLKDALARLSQSKPHRK